MRVAVINLSGEVQLTRGALARSPRPTRSSSGSATPTWSIVDFHAEVTSEKVAMGWHLDGRVAAVLGTHTHVPTADAPGAAEGDRVHLRRRHDRLARRASSGCGSRTRSARCRTQMPTRFETADEDVWVMGAVVDVNQSGLADSIAPVMVPAPVGA